MSYKGKAKRAKKAKTAAKGKSRPKTNAKPVSRGGARFVKDLLERLVPLIDALDDAAYFKDLDGRYQAVNAAFARLAKRPKSRIIGKTDAELFPVELAEKCRMSDFKLFRMKKPVRVEETMGGNGSGPRVFDTIKGPITLPKYGLVGLIGISRDISKYRNAAGEIKELEAQLGKVVGDAPIVLFSVNKEGIFTLSEGHGLARIGLRSGQVVGKSVFKFYADHPQIIRDIEKALKGKTFVSEVEVSGRVFETHYAPHRGPNGKFDGTIGVAIDVTERVRAESHREAILAKEKDLRVEAERVSRSKDDFLALLSHELRTPMTAMIGWTWLLRSKGLGSEEFDMALDTIERNMKTQAQIIEDLLDISRIKSGKMRIESEPVEIKNVLMSVVDVVRPSAEARSIRLDLSEKLPDIVVAGDSERLQQAVWNMVSNAVKFTQESGWVKVRAKRYNDSVEISVLDNGMGIAKEYLPYIFDIFTQAEDTMTREHRGLGLGLALIKHIVEMHGGGVRVYSEGEGKGAEFMMTLPILSIPREKASSVSSVRPRTIGSKEYPDLAGVHVMIVEDEHDTRMVLSASLQYCGARVTGAGTAAEAFDLLRREIPDVMISDLAMPGEDGFSLIRRIRDLDEDEGGGVPAAALTGRADPEDRTQALKSGFQMYILKPVEPAELAAAVYNLARAKRDV